MKNIEYSRKRDGVTCTTKCPFGKDRYVGSLGCQACHYHLFTYSEKRQVLCFYDEENKN